MDIDPAVTLRMPANSAFVVLIRAAVSAMCARLDFTIDRIEDVKLAVDEAAALLLGDARRRHRPRCPVHARTPLTGSAWR